MNVSGKQRSKERLARVLESLKRVLENSYFQGCRPNPGHSAELCDFFVVAAVGSVVLEEVGQKSDVKTTLSAMCARFDWLVVLSPVQHTTPKLTLE